MFPKRLARKTIYESEWINLHIDKVQMPSGKIIEEYHFLDHPSEYVMAVLTNSKKELLLIKSRRYITQTLCWEFPAGTIEKKEKILDAAKREILEETGYITKNLKKIHTIHTANGMSNGTLHVITGEIKDLNQKQFDRDETQETKWFSLDELKKLIAENKILCGSTLSSLVIYLNQ